jgi:Spy/CpxP family protein refolding chaperone
MAVNFKKSLVKIAIAKRLLWSIAILFASLAIAILVTPSIAMTFPTKSSTKHFNTSTTANPTAIIAVSLGNHTTFTEEKLTPQERQELQAVRQRRNRELIQTLNKSQRRQLKHFLRSGQSLENSIESLDLERDQWDTVQAILELSELKIKGILYRHSLPMAPN